MRHAPAVFVFFLAWHAALGPEGLALGADRVIAGAAGGAALAGGSGTAARVVFQDRGQFGLGVRLGAVDLVGHSGRSR
jgi:hypothetical protein